MSFLISKVTSTPIGLLTITSSIKGVETLTLADEECAANIIAKNSKSGYSNLNSEEKAILDIINVANAELKQYFNGKIKAFSFPINLHVSPFHRKVLEAISQIPYGQTATYKEIGLSIGLNKGFRAIGNACNKNPLPLIIPCHRVIGSNGNLTGYAYGINKKKFLLQLEGYDTSNLKV